MSMISKCISLCVTNGVITAEGGLIVLQVGSVVTWVGCDGMFRSEDSSPTPDTVAVL